MHDILFCLKNFEVGPFKAPLGYYQEKILIFHSARRDRQYHKITIYTAASK